MAFELLSVNVPSPARGLTLAATAPGIAMGSADDVPCVPGVDAVPGVGASGRGGASSGSWAWRESRR